MTEAGPIAGAMLFTLAPQRLGGAILSAAAALALGLALVGVYGVLAFSVAQRSREIAVRKAVGATNYQVLRLVLEQGIRLTARGVVIGLVLAVILTRVLSRAVYGVTSGDPLVLLGAMCLILAAAAIASVLPARRAARVHPMSILRSE